MMNLKILRPSEMPSFLKYSCRKKELRIRGFHLDIFYAKNLAK
jgi:hypothetical protein